MLVLNEEQIKDVKNIANGVYAPLKGFLKEEDFLRVVNETRLANDQVWPIPIVLDVNQEEVDQIQKRKEVILLDSRQNEVALLKNPEIYSYDKDLFAEKVFQTKDRNHPGVNQVYKMKDYLIGGEIEILDKSKEPFPEYNFTPAETKKIFQDKGWKTVVAFQTRNIPHCGHEFLQKEALKQADGLFIQPVIGEKKNADFKDEYILTGYEVLIDRYYPKERTFLGILPLKMRYAGPREAIFHALIRKNFGCTHFIVGRDHAGVGDYYGPFDAQNIFNEFKKEEIGMEILKFPEVVYSPSENKHKFITNCNGEETISFSGTKLREYIKNKKQPPAYLIRPEVYYFLANSYNSLVDDMYKVKNKQKGFVLWLTGLSQSGKTTTADKVYEILKERGLRIERLDGDVVREHLSSDLGFSKRDRDENIKRIGFVSGLLSKNGIGVIASFISPYKLERQGVRERSQNFIEIFCNCPLEICEERDTKGLYAKARSGEIKEFTGISDPYENPINPDVEIKTGEEGIEECAGKIVSYIEQKQIIPSTEKENKIGIIGVGMVGGAMKGYFESKGIEPYVYDKGKNFGSMEEVNKADIIFLCVPTPFDKEKQSFDLSYVEESCQNIKGEKIIIIKSTVLPGTTEMLQKKYPQHKFLFSPEFLTEMTAEQDMNYPDRQIIGYTDKSFTISKDIIMLLPLAPFERIISATEAEMVKYFGNNWFAVKVAFANQMYDLCQKLNLDYKKIMEAVAADKRIGPSHLEVMHKGYRGYGGKCLIKDIRAMIEFADKNGIDLKLHKITEEINNQLIKNQGIEDPERFSIRD